MEGWYVGVVCILLRDGLYFPTGENCILVIQEFLPTPLTDDELVTIVAAAIEESAAESARDIGKVMAIVKPKIQGRADMGAVSKMVKEKLA